MVCADFDVERVGMDGENDHVHLLVNSPPKLAVSGLVSSLKRMSSQSLCRGRQDIAARYNYKGVRRTPNYFASRGCRGANIDHPAIY